MNDYMVISLPLSCWIMIHNANYDAELSDNIVAIVDEVVEDFHYIPEDDEDSIYYEENALSTIVEAGLFNDEDLRQINAFLLKSIQTGIRTERN